ncbi:hypothetical protein H072_6299 [Dactylellina haptotyla CBS 200.50]|uniref:YbgI/family dinuclear metal center protein n=1 Tax=Dactylellina haptotyla (strain CBS 200.50) TaxID=1284197 RepID=S8AAL8_DACHA|nr:hypothetical protein H072_6299 [Dactylellina haptotyla CBS 200.50]
MSSPVSSIIRTILVSLRRLYPEHLADKAWDNTGLLLSPPPLSLPPSALKTPKILLTIDLTTAVATEAIGLNAAMVVTYHPIIFRPLKSLTTDNTQQTSLLRLAQAGISVYSPHTAVDAVKRGVNDWLATGVSGGELYETSRTPIQPCPGVQGTEYDGSGYGRLITLKEPTDIRTVVERVKGFLGMNRLQVALAKRHSVAEPERDIKTIAVCAGSGGSVFKDVKADLLFTGEMSHHEALSAKETGTSIIACFHSNTERGYLPLMKQKLLETLPGAWEEMIEEEGRDEMMDLEGWDVVISQDDRDPYEIL